MFELVFFSSPCGIAACRLGGACQPKTKRVGPTGRTSGGNPAIPKKLAQEVRDSPHFYVGSTLPHTTNVGLIPTISLVTHWYSLALTGPTPQSTSDRLHTRAHTDLIPASRPLTGSTHEHTRAYTTRVYTGTRDCGPSSDTNCRPKTRRVGPTGHTPEGNPATPQKLAQEMSPPKVPNKTS